VVADRLNRGRQTAIRVRNENAQSQCEALSSSTRRSIREAFAWLLLGARVSSQDADAKGPTGSDAPVRGERLGLCSQIESILRAK
jgi:hypothetical protein